MGTEIEYRFLVTGSGWREHVGDRRRIEQHYLFVADHGNARVRIIDDEKALLTVKGRRRGATRPEYEWPLDVADARSMVQDVCAGDPIIKVRSFLRGQLDGWVVDEFEGANSGLVIAEVEVAQEGAVEPPPWAGREVTADDRFSNASLSQTPYSTFGDGG